MLRRHQYLQRHRGQSANRSTELATRAVYTVSSVIIINPALVAKPNENIVATRERVRCKLFLPPSGRHPAAWGAEESGSTDFSQRD